MIYFRSDRTKEPYYSPADSDLYGVRVTGGEPVKIASIDGVIERPSPSPDGRNIAFIGSLNGTAPRSYDQPDLFIASAAGGAGARNLTAGYDFDIGGLLAGDQHAPRGSAPPPIMWSPDGRSLIVAGAEQGSTHLKRVEVATGTVTKLTNASQEIISYSMSANGTQLAALISTPTSIGDLFMIDPSSGRQTQITHVNDDLFKQIRQSEPEEFWYSSFDGKKIQGWILKPPGFDPSRKYPAILQIHGGPHSAYGNTFTHEFSWMAARGYVVIYTNPRGSTTYGQDFGNIIQFHYPGDDFKDLMAAVDEVVKRGFVDDRRMGVAGGSGGGVLTNWTIGHTTRFAAAVSLRSIADWTGFWYTADFAQFQPFWFRGAPWEDPADFAARSPISYVTKITTPLMLIEGESDMRTPPADGGEQMFRALKYLRKPVVMVRFPEETHELSRSGKPAHRVERLRHIVGWFDTYLQGAGTTAYDVK
jgi:dipeptidyl aminopeptidase/acylaminoacyl peptidase